MPLTDKFRSWVEASPSENIDFKLIFVDQIKLMLHYIILYIIF
jgi:hypothetical protein